MHPDKETPAKLKDFTPLLDALIQRYDVTTAAVWGRVWRYEQGKNKVCQASHETIAMELHLSERTVIRKLQQLAKDGYLTDHTPDLRNRPHTYSTTRKARIEITIQGVTESHTYTEEGVTESQSTMTESHPQGDTESHEDTKKKQVKKGSPNGALARQKIATEELEQLEQTFADARGVEPPDWETDPKGSQKTWRTPLKQLSQHCHSFEDTETLVLSAIRKMNGLTFTKPVQIVETALSLLADKKPRAPETDRYQDVY